MSKLLQVKNLTVRLDNNIIINNLSFSVQTGEFLTILGPNGAGKSVLIKVLLGLLPYQGEIHWYQKLPIAYLPQGLNQLLTKGMPLTINDFFNLKKNIPDHKTIIKFLNLVGLNKNILSQTASSLSGGQFQRMLIAWSLIANPKIIFLDEPTTGIDIGGGLTIYTLLKKIQRQRQLTIFVVSHDLHIVSKYSSHVLCLNNQERLCFGKPQDIMNTKTLMDIFGKGIKLYDHHH